MKWNSVLGCAAGALLLLGIGTAPARADLLHDIMQAKTLRVSTDVAIPPAGMMDAQMHPIGSDVETAELLAKDWGLKLVFIPTTGATRIPNVLTGKADIIISTLSVTPDRAKVIDFSAPYRVLQSVVGGAKGITVTSLEGLKGMTVSVTRGTTQDTDLSQKAAQFGFHVVRYDDDATLVTAGVTGQAQLVATSDALVSQIAKKSGNGFAPKFVLANFDISIGLRKGEPALMAKLNEWIAANLKNGKLNAIYKKYYGVDLPEAMRK